MARAPGTQTSRRLLLNGPRPHPSIPRHDPPNRPPGPVPTGCGARASHEQTNSSFDPASCHATPSPETRSSRQHPVGKAATVAGGDDPGSSAEHLSERFFGLRISGFAAIALKDVTVRWRSRPADETSAFPGGANPGVPCGLSHDRGFDRFRKRDTIILFV